MSKKAKTVDIECASAFMAGGKMITPGKLVRGVPVDEAKNLERRGKAKIMAAGPDDSEAEAPSLQELSVEELKATAREHAVAGAEKMKKAELIAAIEAVEAEGDE